MDQLIIASAALPSPSRPFSTSFWARSVALFCARRCASCSIARWSTSSLRESNAIFRVISFFSMSSPCVFRGVLTRPVTKFGTLPTIGLDPQVSPNLETKAHPLRGQAFILRRRWRHVPESNRTKRICNPSPEARVGSFHSPNPLEAALGLAPLGPHYTEQVLDGQAFLASSSCVTSHVSHGLARWIPSKTSRACIRSSNRR